MIPASPSPSRPSSAEPILAVQGLDAHYGRARILHGVDLSLPAGSVLALLGRNGAGKSTTLKTLIGLVPASAGQIRFLGRPITGWPAHRIARAGLGYVPEERRIFTDLTVMENLSVGRQPPRPQRIAWTPEALFEIFPNLGEMRHRPGGRMSGGEQQMLTIARSLMGNPLCLLLDEPSEGLSPLIVEQMATAIGRLKQAGISLVISEQNLHFAAAVADHATIIEKGVIRHAGPMAALAADDALKHRYLSV